MLTDGNWLSMIFIWPTRIIAVNHDAMLDVSHRILDGFTTVARFQVLYKYNNNIDNNNKHFDSDCYYCRTPGRWYLLCASFGFKRIGKCNPNHAKSKFSFDFHFEWIRKFRWYLGFEWQIFSPIFSGRKILRILPIYWGNQSGRQRTKLEILVLDLAFSITVNDEKLSGPKKHKVTRYSEKSDVDYQDRKQKNRNYNSLVPSVNIQTTWFHRNLLPTVFYTLYFSKKAGWPKQWDWWSRFVKASKNAVNGSDKIRQNQILKTEHRICHRRN